MIKMIVGLGNPGLQYAKTRHNAGFWFIDSIRNAPLSLNNRFKGLVGEQLFGSQKVYLLEPETFMNKSGDAVVALALFYKIMPEEILVVHDELDLAPGVARFKKGGGHGGHNGLKSIIERLGSRDFMRLRIGIGHPGHASLVSSYVLTKTPEKDENEIFQAIDAARAVLPQFVAGEYEKAMNELHRR
ncbi:peptidyl-tRNA hydrolase [Ignatzschineria indica]|uniref:Peptidyl-tRNA hydrolase n=1 Tax=Ignatzschineria indica TaxID=472583 RepID=A0A2U2AJM4_9GAMM|nr:aminoacyl-tRNA hydrolase [Ignatzschineria indica]MDM1545717.1 aminoacyl-tRNA hydrolase [Ignatzschineria indica]PWD83017.1 aminoacyl-tRNA hydrolase [Ignatzschineria indica]GGZ83562.1 peptidyl-tRNA hydrolase [Ignatzschineria indica]